MASPRIPLGLKNGHMLDEIFRLIIIKSNHTMQSACTKDTLDILMFV